MAASEPVDRGWLDRWAGLGGVLYVVFFVVGVIFSWGGQPDTGSPPAKLIAYYRDSGHRDRINVGWLFMLVAVFFFLWFLGALRVRLRAFEGEGLLPVVATVGGAAYAACTLVAFSVNAGVKTMSDDTYRHQVYPGLIHAADDTAYVIHSAGGAAIAAMMVAASLAALRARAVPGWLGWLGVVVGLIAVVSIFFFPWFAIAAWIVVVSVMLVRRRPQGAQSAPR